MDYDPLDVLYRNHDRQGREMQGPIPADWCLKGDLIRVGESRRKVRQVARDAQTGYVRSVWCVKKRRSGYRSPMTYVSRHQLRAGYRGLVERGVGLYTTQLEEALQAELDQYADELREEGVGPAHEWGLTESDVVGVLI